MENNDIAVKVEGVSMQFNMSSEKVDSIKEYFIRFMKRQLLFKPFWALNDISFEVKRGETLGIIGLNGSGKSTLLKVVSGVLKPTTGSAVLNGTLSPLIELGAGFDSDLTGRENIYLNGAVLGYSKQFMESVSQEIIDFSEIGEFIDTQIKNYSSGMQARLAFSIATVVKPQILILDEVLGVGDFKFQQKCEKRIKELMEGDTTVLFVSHSIDQVKRVCEKIIWLEKGRIKMMGDTKTVCDAYDRT